MELIATAHSGCAGWLYDICPKCGGKRFAAANESFAMWRHDKNKSTRCPVDKRTDKPGYVPPPYEISEADIQKECLKLLKKKRIMHWRQNSGSAKGGRLRFGVPGAPDIFAVRRGILIGIEVKRPYGEQSPKQHEFQVELERAGGKYWLVRSVEELESNLRAISKEGA